MKRYVLVFVLLLSLKAIAQFTPGNIVVSRVGDGSTLLSPASAQVQLVEYTTAGVPTGVVVTLPTVEGTPGNRACTNSGTATTEGYLTQSFDGRYLTQVGYDANPGTSNIASSTVNRTVARIDFNGSVNTSTSYLATAGNAYSGVNIRSGVTNDGTQFWTSGGSDATAGIRYLTLGQDNIAGIQISTSSTNTRVVKIFNNQLFVSTGAGTLRLATVGTGLPTTSGQTITNLNGVPTTVLSSNSFIFFDRDPLIPGDDLVYLACQSTTAGAFGLFKYSFDGTIWTTQGSIQTNAQLLGLTGYIDCSGNIVLYSTRSTAGNSLPTQIRQYVDNAPYNALMTSNGGDFLTASTLLVTASANYAFRGLSMSPAQGYTVTGTQNIAAGNYNVITVKSGGVATLTGNITVYDRIVVESGGVLEMGNFIISSPAGIGSRFEVQSGGTIKIGSAQGITASAAAGNVQTCFRKYNAGANYEYYGTAAQVTGNGLPANLTGTLKINNSAGLPSTGVTLSQATSISGTLDLTLGKLTSTAAQLLTMNNTSALVNAGANSFVNGPIKKVGNDVSFTFPVGKGSIYAPLGISGGSGAAATDEFTAEYVRGNPQSTTGACPVYCQPGMDHVSFVEYWTLDRNIGSVATKQVTLDVHATSFCAEINNTYVSQWDPSAPNKWSKELSSSILTGTIGILELGTVTTINPITAFAANRFFTLGTDRPFVNNPLPVRLLDFTAKKYSEQAALIEWELSDNCFAATKFELERSTDKQTFTVIAVLPGKENSRLYFHNDTRLAKGTNWYRLKITEVDGKVTYSKVAAVINDSKGILITSLAPNPVNSMATLTLSAAKTGAVQLQVLDMSGTVVQQWLSAVAEGTNNLPVNLGKLPAGIYLLTVQSAESKAVLRFVKQ